MTPSTCLVSHVLTHANMTQEEVARLVLEDFEGYTDDLAAKCLGQMTPLGGSLRAEHIKAHRAKACDCEDR